MDGIQKDSSYSCLVMVAAFLGQLLVGLSTYGSVPVLVYVWGEMFNLSTDDTVWSAAIMSGFFFLTGR